MIFLKVEVDKMKEDTFSWTNLIEQYAKCKRDSGPLFSNSNLNFLYKQLYSDSFGPIYPMA